MIRKCNANKIPTGINLDLNEPLTEEEEPTQPAYQSSEEDSEESNTRMDPRALKKLLVEWGFSRSSVVVNVESNRLLVEGIIDFWQFWQS